MELRKLSKTIAIINFANKILNPNIFYYLLMKEILNSLKNTLKKKLISIYFLSFWL